MTFALACQPTAGSGDSPEGSEPPFVAAAPATGSAIVFPPPPSATPRGPTPIALTDDAGPRSDIDWPTPDDSGHFGFSGSRLGLSFSRRVQAPTDPLKALTIDPPVVGEIEWSSWSVGFSAKDGFDPAQTYTVTLAGVLDEAGAPIAEGWTATFKARPQIEIAGKVIDYLPEPGKSKLVAVRPWSGARVGADAAVILLFDQKVDLKALAARFTLTVGGVASDPVLRHPKKGEYEGVAVAREHVVELRPATVPAAGSAIDLRIAGPKAGDDEERVELSVAEPLKWESASCGWGGSSDCALTAGEMPLPDRNFTIVLNNPVDMNEKQLARAVKISPRVANLSVWSDRWSDDGRVHVSGDFAYSKTYHVTVKGLRDRFGDTLAGTESFDLVRPSQSASIAMAEGVQFVDAAGSRAFEVTTRNVETAKLALWEVGPTARAYEEAHRQLSSRERPSGTPDVVIPIKPRSRRDTSVSTKIDLLAHLSPGKNYVARLELGKVAFGAPPPSYPSWSLAAADPMALVTPHDDNAIVMHAHASGGETLVHVARLATGEALAGASVTVDGDASRAVTTDAHGLAVVASEPRPGHTLLLSADHKGDLSTLALGSSSLAAGHIAPELTGGTTAKGDMRALIVTDRGAYRPGDTVHIKTWLRKRSSGGTLAPVAAQAVRLRVLDPAGKDALSVDGKTTASGGFTADFNATDRAPVGRYRIVIGPTEGTDTYAEQTIQVAEFETPRFTVDVDVTREADDKVAANIAGTYLFGAPMEGADVSWTLRRADAATPDGPFSRRGLSFRAYRGWYEREHDSAGTWMRSGTGELAADGRMALRQVVEMPTDRGPQRFTLEAEVSDESHRTIAGRAGVVLHAADQYAGIKVSDHWLDAGKEIPFEVGVIDQEGRAVSGKEIRVALTRQRWVRTRKSGPSGSTVSDWHVVNDDIATCTTMSAGTVSTCPLATTGSGDYRITAYVDGKAGGSDYLWAWGSDWDSASPDTGRTLQVSTDKQRYKPGDTARLVVASPYAKATAIVTLEGSRIEHRRVETLTSRAGSFEVKIPKTVDGPWIHATVTLLPIGGKGADVADWKIGAVRLPLELTDVTLGVTAKSDKAVYEPGQRVEVDIDVTRDGKPAANAEVVLAIVDEGVLRLTDHHAPDPVPSMHPGQPLVLTIDDNRRAFAELLARSHTAGDGPGSGAQSLVGARKKFVRTALWKPDLRTDAKGHIDVGFELPDNLTRFRIMAVALDDEGRGGTVEDGFNVRKPLMAEPAVPRFATVGDSFDAAVMVHNNTDSDEEVTVQLDERTEKVTIAAKGHKRVAFSIAPKESGIRTLVFSVKDGEGVERDRVVAKIPVNAPGIDERPRLSGAFVGTQQVSLQVPKKVSAGRSGDDFVTVTLGEQLWPELSGRLEYLVEYPHGCVEQTTSSTVPLLAAREILPRLGATRWSSEEIDKMILAGVQRLDTMRTPSGGLAYWPGGHEPNVYGTAYAMNAVVGAKRAGIEPPPGLLEGMRTYLLDNLTAGHLPYGTGPEVRASMALSLAEADGLPTTAADALFDTKGEQGGFGLAALAIALSTLDNEAPRTATLLDELEAKFDDEGSVIGDAPAGEYHYYGSSLRTQAAAAIALGRLRPESTKLPSLVRRLLEATHGYTTQGTAYALLALTEHIDRQDDLVASGRVRALIDGIPIEALLGEAVTMGPGAMQYRVPLDRLRGHDVVLQLEAETEAAVGFSIGARWRRELVPGDATTATTGARAPDVWRVVTDVDGNAIDPNTVEAGATLRVVLLARLPHGRVDSDRMGYLALSDRLPAGFEALQPDLWTVASVPELSAQHPLYSMMRWGSEASHVELRDESAHFYFDRVWGEYAHATYLMRATTPGTFVAAPASAELMYEPDGVGFSESLRFEVKR